MSFFLPELKTKKEIDEVIKKTEDKVLALRFGRKNDPSCLRLDHILAKTYTLLSKMADIYIVEVDDIPVYTHYFDITLIPATVFFFNGQHIKVDYGTQDHTKFIGCFQEKQDFIDLIEVIFRGAMQGKLMINSPIDSTKIPKFDLLYKDI